MPGWLGDLAASARACAGSEPTGPCRSSGTLRTALPVIVRSEWPMKRIIAPSSATAAASDEDPQRRSAPARATSPARASRSGGAHGRLRPHDPAVGELDLARPARGDVGVVGGDHEREAELAPAAPRSGRGPARRCRSRGGRSARRRAAARAAGRAPGRSRRAAPRRRRARPAERRPCPPGRPARAARPAPWSASARPAPRRQAAKATFSKAVKVGQQVRALKDVGDAAAPAPRRGPRRRGRRAARPSRAPAPRSARAGRRARAAASSCPSRSGPSRATLSPGAISRSTPASALDPRLARARRRPETPRQAASASRRLAGRDAHRDHRSVAQLDHPVGGGGDARRSG